MNYPHIINIFIEEKENIINLWTKIKKTTEIILRKKQAYK